MANKKEIVPIVTNSDTLARKTNAQNDVENSIFTIRGVQVMLDSDLARFYGIETKSLNQAVKRNIERFPEDFMFQLTKEEHDSLRSQIVTLNNDSALRSQIATFKVGRGEYRKYLPYVFTEQGVAQLSGILHSPIAIQMSVKIARAFVAMRRFITTNARVFQRLDRIELTQLHESEERKQLEARFDNLLSRLDNGSVKPIEGVFYNGQIFEAYVFVSDLIKLAKKTIILIDNYIDESVFTLLDKREKGVDATIYTQTINEQNKLDIKKHNAQYQPIEIKQTKNIHDRFLIIDDTVYHIGASIKDLGKKLFAFSKMDMAAKGIIEHL